jgi:hypothetical protein
MSRAQLPRRCFPGEFFAASPPLDSAANAHHLQNIAPIGIGETAEIARLEIFSSNFPRFDRTLSTGEEQARATRIVKATNAIYHDKARPSALIVPVVS